MRPSRRRIAVALLVLGAWSATPAHADPTIAHATYLGGTSDDAEVFGAGIVDVAVDASGNVYLTGTTRSADFPTTPGMDETLDGDLDIFVTKLSPTGEVIYSTYFGGPCDDVVRDIAVVGTPASAYFTGRINGGSCFEDVQPGALVAKLDSTGDVLYSVVLGGSAGDESIGTAIAVDGSGLAYVTGVAKSASHDFPTTPDAIRGTDCGGPGADVFVARVTKNPRLAYSTFLCGGGDDVPSAIAFDEWGSIYVAGTTGSTDFPMLAALQGAPRGGGAAVTGFVTKIAPLGEQLVWSTYLGGSQGDAIGGLAIDGQKNVYVTGVTQSVDFPTTPGVLQEHAGSRACAGGCTDAFVTKIDASGSALAYSTYLYGELDELGSGIAVDGAGNAYVAGATTSTYFPIAGAFQPRNRGLADAFVTKLTPDGTRLVYSSYLGGSASGASPATGWDMATSIALGGNGDAYLAGYTMSFDLPTTVDAFQQDLAPGICDALGNPCGDTFFARIADGGPAPLPAVNVTVTPHEVAPGGTLTATWAGLPAPAVGDELKLLPLGASGEKLPNAGDLSVSWPTNGQAAGNQPLDLPEWVAPGSWELRLLSADPSIGKTAVMARSDPIRVVTVTTTTTVPPPTVSPLCEIAGAAVCDDGDPCTDDACAAGRGCVSTPAERAASVTCTCRRPHPAVCAGALLPPAVDRRRERACSLVADGASSPKRLRAAMKQLKGAMKVVTRGRKKGSVSRECAGALATELRDARDRVARLLAASNS